MLPFYRRPALAALERRTVASGRGEEAVAVELETLDHVGLVVSDMSRSIRWYQEVLGLGRAWEDAWGEFPAVLEAAKAELRARGIEFHEGDHGVAWSVYLPDPDGYQVEITTYEPTGE